MKQSIKDFAQDVKEMLNQYADDAQIVYEDAFSNFLIESEDEPEIAAKYFDEADHFIIANLINFNDLKALNFKDLSKKEIIELVESEITPNAFKSSEFEDLYSDLERDLKGLFNNI